MKLFDSTPSPSPSLSPAWRRIDRRNCRGFTMAEIAFCVAIVAFALVAIIGVLPRGLKVQKENRQDTVLNLDGSYLLEAIRSGAQGLDDLTNYFESITIRRGGVSLTYTNGPGNQRLWNGRQIIGLLSTPKYEYRFNSGGSLERVTNQVTARVRAINGVASEKGSLTNQFAFRYFLTSEVIPYWGLPEGTPVPGATAIQMTHLRSNLFDLRLVLRGPIYQRGNTWEATGPGRLFRAQVGGALTHTNGLYFFEPYRFTRLTP